MKSVDIKTNTHIDYSTEINDKNGKLKIVNIAIISKYKILFSKVLVPNWSEKLFVMKKVKNNTSWTNVINDLKGKKMELFMKTKCKKQIRNN